MEKIKLKRRNPVVKGYNEMYGLKQAEIRGAIRLREIMRKKEYTVEDRKFLLEINKESE